MLIVWNPALEMTRQEICESCWVPTSTNPPTLTVAALQFDGSFFPGTQHTRAGPEACPSNSAFPDCVLVSAAPPTYWNLSELGRSRDGQTLDAHETGGGVGGGAGAGVVGAKVGNGGAGAPQIDG